MKTALTTAEESRLAELENVIRGGMTGFLAVGGALLEVRESRLFRGSFPTFEDYCRKRWSMGRSHAQRLIQATEISEGLVEQGGKPLQREAQARPLAAVPEPQRAAVWAKAAETTPEPTARQIEDVAARALAGLSPERQREVIQGAERRVIERTTTAPSAKRAKQIARAKSLLARARILLETLGETEIAASVGEAIYELMQVT